MARLVELSLSPEKWALITSTLRAYHPDTSEANAMAGRIDRVVTATKARWAEEDADQLRRDNLRAERAKNATLTDRQAMALAAVRAGQGVSHKVERSIYTNLPEWKRSRNMGGAVKRMRETLVDEGLLDDKTKLTAGGLTRLEAYEEKHPAFKKLIAEAK